eukprot:5182302-Pyramimonas_sp.AAC.1
MLHLRPFFISAASMKRAACSGQPMPESSRPATRAQAHAQHGRRGLRNALSPPGPPGIQAVK